MDIVAHCRPNVVINCAGFTDVERAEDDVDRSFSANALLPALLAAGARRQNASMVHFSSTGCFGNWTDRPYTDLDKLRPTTVYHRTKLEGDERVRAEMPGALIIRTGWLFGDSPRNERNFVWCRLLEARNTERLFADQNQKGNPTPARDLANQTLELIEQGITGTFNCVGRGSATRFEYVARIVEYSGLPCRVEVAPAGHFKRRAPVSHNEAASNTALKLLNCDKMQDWRDALDSCVTSLMPLLTALS